MARVRVFRPKQSNWKEDPSQCSRVKAFAVLVSLLFALRSPALAEQLLFASWFDLVRVDGFAQWGGVRVSWLSV